MNRRHFAWVMLLLLYGSLSHAELNIDIDALFSKPKKAGKPTTGKPPLVVPAATTGDAPAEKKATVVKPDVLHFFGEDRLSGSLVGISADGKLAWRHEECTGPLVFGTTNAKSVTLGAPALAKRPGDATVRLTNGDSLWGSIVEQTSEVLTLETPYAGTLRLLCPMIASIHPASSDELLYSGISDTEGWTLPKDGGGWSFANGNLIAKGSGCTAGRAFEKLPDALRVDFTFRWGNSPSLVVGVFATRIGPAHTYAGYQIQLNNDYMNVQIRSADGHTNGLGNHRVQGFSTKRTAKMSFLADRKRETVVILVDGVLVRQWNNAGGTGPNGTNLVFYSGTNLQSISELRVSKWDGKLPDTGSGGEEDKDSVVFANGDRVTGTLVGIQQNVATFKSDFAELKVPTHKIARITLAAKSRARARRTKGDAATEFEDGGRITFALGTLAGGKLSGKSENFGETTFSLNAFAKVFLNIYDKRWEKKNG
ncbi:MAG: hypothetical protein KAI66_05655, partial [Lentisphaeria bacterium]|nr:hypothetical protein [Lentisphaeria bacterium]